MHMCSLAFGGPVELLTFSIMEAHGFSDVFSILFIHSKEKTPELFVIVETENNLKCNSRVKTRYIRRTTRWNSIQLSVIL